MNRLCTGMRIEPPRGGRRSPVPNLVAALVCPTLVLAICASAGCARNPVTGRPDAVLTTEQGEIDQGNEAAKAVAEQIGFVDSPELAAYVEALGQRLAGRSPRAGLAHSFQVVQMREPNAFALPGGHIYVSRGLLALVNSEDELANVIGHEIAHVAARHSVTRQAANAPMIPVRILAGLGGAAASIVSPSIGRMVSGVGQLPGEVALAAYSRDQEREADRLGQQFAAAAGFDPAAMASFMNSLSREEALAGQEPGRVTFLASHPRSPERSDAAVTRAKDMSSAIGEPPPLERKEFLARIEGLPVGDSAAEGVFLENRFLHPLLGVGLEFPEGWKPVNTPAAVAALQPNQLGQVVVEVVAEGTDPMEQALAFDREIPLISGPKRLEIAGLRAVQADVDVGARSERMRVLMTWIAHDGRIYRISGGSSRRHFEPLRPTFVAAAESFHVLDQTERNEILQDTLRVATAEPGEDLAALGKRTGNRWSVEATAVANGLEIEAPLVPGSLIKIAVGEPYVAKAPEPGKESAGEAGQESDTPPPAP